MAADSKPNLDGRRLADRLLSASDAVRRAFSPKAIAMTLRRHGMKVAALRADFVLAHTPTYSNEVPPTPIRNQAKSGRCWIFTALNVVEQEANAAGTALPKLSRAWLNAKNLQSVAYDLLHTGATASDLRDTSVHGLGEGGHFAWAMNLIDKYGVVPEHFMRDSFDSRDSATTIKLLETIVVDAQEKLRSVDKHGQEAIAIVRQAQHDIDRTIALAFTGKHALPETFVVGGKTYTPKSYAEQHVTVKASDFVTLSNWQENRVGWATSGTGVHALAIYNTDSVDIMKDAMRAAIDQGKKVYLSVPVGGEAAPYLSEGTAAQGAKRVPGVMSLAAWDYASIGIKHPNMTRLLRQRSNLNATNHAVTGSGYDLDSSGTVVKWKIDNSWGTSAGDRGVQHVYDDFLTAFVGVVTVPRNALSEALLARIDAEKNEMGSVSWDPK